MSRPAVERVWLWPGSEGTDAPAASVGAPAAVNSGVLENAGSDAAPWENLADELGGETALAKVFWYRGLHDLAAVRAAYPPLNLDTEALEEDLQPWALADMEAAVAGLLSARESGELVTVYGDYDVDGTTSVALVSHFLRTNGWQVRTYIPDRTKEGYGLGPVGVEAAAAGGGSWLVALDCGIKSHKEIALANSLGLRVVVCDHHTPDATLPEAVAVLNAKRADDQHPFKEFSACGVGFLLCLALAQRLESLGMADVRKELWHWVDLVAVSIGADLVPVVGLNRRLVQVGLHRMNHAPRPAWTTLLRSRRTSVLTLEDVGFGIAPRINAAGRMAHGHLAVDLLTAPTEELLEQVASLVEAHNEDRKSTDQSILLEALEQVEAFDAEAGVVLFAPHWHKGVVGIVAQRVVEAVYKPTVVLTQSGEVLAGSARSVEGFDLYAALLACSPHLIQFGGHRAAAGMTLKPENLDAFRAAFAAYCEQQLRPEQRRPRLRLDAEVQLHELTPRTELMLSRMAPFGVENPAVVWGVLGVRLRYARPVGADGKHLKAVLEDPISGARLDWIGFGWGHFLEAAQNPELLFDVAFHLERNEYQGNVALQGKGVGLRLHAMGS
jgi:single-stranded-DNA-specific exonuclease